MSSRENPLRAFDRRGDFGLSAPAAPFVDRKKRGEHDLRLARKHPRLRPELLQFLAPVNLLGVVVRLEPDVTELARHLRAGGFEGAPVALVVEEHARLRVTCAPQRITQRQKGRRWVPRWREPRAPFLPKGS